MLSFKQSHSNKVDSFYETESDIQLGYFGLVLTDLGLFSLLGQFRVHEFIVHTFHNYFESSGGRVLEFLFMKQNLIFMLIVYNS